jgi:hypothetical protein
MASSWMALFQDKPAHQKIVDGLLYHAVLHNDLSHVKEFVFAGANPQANNGAAFDMASRAENPRIGKFLSPPIPWEDFNTPDRERRLRAWWDVCENPNAEADFKALLAPAPAPAKTTARRRPA